MYFRYLSALAIKVVCMTSRLTLERQGEYMGANMGTGDVDIQ